MKWGGGEQAFHSTEAVLRERTRLETLVETCKWSPVFAKLKSIIATKTMSTKSAFLHS